MTTNPVAPWSQQAPAPFCAAYVKPCDMNPTSAAAAASSASSSASHGGSHLAGPLPEDAFDAHMPSGFGGLSQDRMAASLAAPSPPTVIMDGEKAAMSPKPLWCCQPLSREKSHREEDRDDFPLAQLSPASQPFVGGVLDGVDASRYNVDDAASMRAMEVWRVAAQCDDLPPQFVLFCPDGQAGTEQNGAEGSVERQKQNREDCQIQNLAVLEVLLLCRSCREAPSIPTG